MNIITGTGQQAWAPERVTVETLEGEQLGPEVISAQLTYGPLGACQGGQLMLAQVPPGWQDAAYHRVVRVRLESEHGTGYVFAGLLEQVKSAREGLSTATLLPLHTLMVDGPEPGLGVLLGNGAGTNARIYGIEYGGNEPGETRRAAIDRALAPYPNSEYGVGPDLDTVLGLPMAARPASYAVDSRAYVVESQGVVITNYITHAVFDPGDGWRKYVYARPGVPLLTPQRTGRATAEQAILTEPGEIPFDWIRNSGAAAIGSPGTYTEGGYRWSSLVTVPTRTDVRNITKATVEFTVDIGEVKSVGGSVDGNNAHLQFAVYDDATDELLAVQRPTLLAGMTGVYKIRFDLPLELFGKTLRAAIYLAQTPPGHQVTLTVVGGRVVTEEQRANLAAVQMPPEFYQPFWVGPTYQVSLPGWHVPPLALSGLPVGGQFAAGATVTWNRGEASTLITTTVWPYRR